MPTLQDAIAQINRLQGALTSSALTMRLRDELAPDLEGLVKDGPPRKDGSPSTASDLQRRSCASKRAALNSSS